jgi:Domain of unknown function (DU1801)
MQSDAPTVDAYLDSLAPALKTDLVALRNLIFSVDSTLVESMQYKMPCYNRPAQPDKTVFAFNAQKNYLALYVLDIPSELRDTLKDFNVGKGCIRFKSVTPERLATLRTILEANSPTTNQP